MPTPQQQINYGNTANDGQGDPLRTAFIKVDDNFDAVWAAGPVGSNITILNNTVAAVTLNGNLVISANGVGVIQTNSSMMPQFANSYDLGTANLRYRSIAVGSGGADISGNVVAGAVFTDDYFLANGAPFSPVSSYGNANVADFLPSYTGNISANSINVDFIVNEFPVKIITNGGDQWQFAGNILRGPQGGTWQSSANTMFLNSPANGFINLISFVDGNLATELYMEHGFVRIRVDNGGPERNWNFRVTGVSQLPIVSLDGLEPLLGGRAMVSDANLTAAGNFGAQVGSGGSNTVPVWSDGTNWYMG
jgi:hypothetical protein